MEYNNRTPGIKENLKQDTKDLLRASARLVTHIFKGGLCTVRNAAERWKSFVKDSGAEDPLFTPAFIRGAEMPEAVFNPEAQPFVTITKSSNRNLKAGRHMTLSQANALIEKLDQEREYGGQPEPITLKIDYMLEGKTDRYWVNLDLNDGGGSLMERIKSQMERGHRDNTLVDMLLAQVSPEYRQKLGQELIPSVLKNSETISTQLLHFFQRHCDISALENSFAKEARTLPENIRQEYLLAARETIIRMRKDANVAQPASISIAPKEQKRPPSVREDLKQYQKKTAAHGRGGSPQEPVR